MLYEELLTALRHYGKSRQENQSMRRRRRPAKPSHPNRTNGSFVIGSPVDYGLGMLPLTKTQLNSASDVAGTYKVRFVKLFFFLILCSPCHSIRALIIY